MTASDVERCRDCCVDFLNSVADRDWSGVIPHLGMSVRDVVTHQAGVLFWYSLDLAARGQDIAMVPDIDDKASPAKLIETFRAAATMLAAVVGAAPPEARGFHPFGKADASGFAAMGCDEMLVHTHDISRGLGISFEPPAELVSLVLARLFPWIEGVDDDWLLLQFANGRIALDGRDQLGKWLWHCAPIAEWDGTVPIPPASM